MAKVLVTGANGFIGSHLVQELVNRGHDVNCLIRYASDISSLRGLPVFMFINDIREPETLVSPLKDVEYVYHLAAEVMGTNRETFDQSIRQGTINLLEAVNEHASGRLKRFLYVSSQAAAGPADNPTPLTEDDPPNPISWYGTAKKQAEESVLSYADRFPVTIVRPSSVYGEREKEISQTFPIIENRLQPKLGIMTKYVVMVYVKDLVCGMIEAAESGNTVGKIYFLHHPQIMTIKDATKGIAQAMGKPRGIMFPVPFFLIRLAAPFAELVHIFSRTRPQLTRDKAREMSQRFWVTDPSRAKRDFGWEARYDLVQGMQITTQHFRQQEKDLREMPLERGFLLWFKYIVCAILIGGLIEMTSAIGHFYTFTPRWAGWVVAIVGFGLGLGTLAMWLRRQNPLLQFAIGSLVVGVAEALNELQVPSPISWQFAPGWPFGITEPWIRVLVLSTAGGFFVLLVNYLARLLYKRRLRFG